MSKTKKMIMALLLALLMAGGIFPPAGADDDDDYGHREYRHREYEHEEHEHREYRRGHGEREDHGREHLRPVDNPVYRQVCGACHMAYPPGLLPSASWMKILAGRDDHFGETVELDDNAGTEITGYLQANGAETGSSERSFKIMRSLGGLTPLRITEVPYIQEKHMGIPPDFLHGKAVGSFSNCIACHPGADRGDYDDDDVKIPR